MTDSPTYRLYRNVGAPFFAYEPGTMLWYDPTPFAIADASTAPDALDGEAPLVLDAIFYRHNRDDRPDGPYAPSLSVGDVIALDWGTERTRFFSVDSFGFTEVEGPLLTEVYNTGHPELGELHGESTWSEAMKPYRDAREAENAAYEAKRRAEAGVFDPA